MYNRSKQRMESRHASKMREIQTEIRNADLERKREETLTPNLEKELDEELRQTDKMEDMLNSVCKYVETCFQQERREREITEREHAERFAEVESRLRSARRDEIVSSEESSITRKKLVNVVLEMNERGLEIRKQNLEEANHLKEISSLRKKRRHFENELAATKSLLRERENRHAQEIRSIRDRGTHLAEESEVHLNELNRMLETARNEMKTKIEFLSGKCFEIAMETASRRTEQASVWKAREMEISRELKLARSEERCVQEELNECVLEERSNAMRDATEMRALEHRLALSRVEYQDAQHLEAESAKRVQELERMSDRLVQELESRGVLIERTVLEEQIACQYHKEAVQDLASRLVAQIPMGRLRQDTSSSLSPIPTPPSPSSSSIPELRRRLSSASSNSSSLPPGRLDSDSLNNSLPLSLSSKRGGSQYGPPGIASPSSLKTSRRRSSDEAPPGILRKTSITTLGMVNRSNSSEGLKSRGMSVFDGTTKTIKKKKPSLDRPPGRISEGWSPATVKYRKSMSQKSLLSSIHKSME